MDKRGAGAMTEVTHSRHEGKLKERAPLIAGIVSIVIVMLLVLTVVVAVLATQPL